MNWGTWRGIRGGALANQTNCPGCGTSGQVAPCDEVTFSGMGIFEGQPVAKCLSCGRGFRFTLNAGMVQGKPVLVPIRRWRAFEKRWNAEHVALSAPRISSSSSSSAVATPMVAPNEKVAMECATLATSLYQRADQMSQLSLYPPQLLVTFRDVDRFSLELFCLNCFIYEYEVRLVFTPSDAQRILDAFYLVVYMQSTNADTTREVLADRHERNAAAINTNPLSRGVSLGWTFARALLECADEDAFNLDALAAISERSSGDLVDLEQTLEQIRLTTVGRP